VNQRRITVHDAARQLGISEDAVRMRVKRGTLEAEREGGRLYVILTDEPTTEPTGRTDELVEELRDRVRYLERQVEEERSARFRADQLLARLMERVPELEPPAPPESPEPREEPDVPPIRPERAEPAGPVDPQREEPERVEPQRVEPERVEPRESPVTAADEQQGRGPVPGAEGPQESAQRPWWRRVFGG
jgi:excisionase family DNA binding protein